MNPNDKKIHHDDVIGNLPAEDQQQIRAWLACYSLRKVQKLAAQPRPDGLDLHINHNTIGRYNRKIRAEQAIASSGLDATQLLAQLHEKASIEILDPDATLTDQAALARIILRMATLQQRDQTRQHEAQRHDLKLLNTIRDHFPMLHRVNWEAETKDAQSIERLKRLLKLVPQDAHESHDSHLKSEN